MSSQQSIWESFKALFDTDSDTDGLQGTGSAKVHGGMFREGDPQQTKNTPHIRLQIASEQERDSPGNRHVWAVVRLILVTKRDTDFTIQNAIATRIQAVFDDGALPTKNSWVFAPAHRLRGFQGPVGEDGNQYIEEYFTVLSK